MNEASGTSYACIDGLRTVVHVSLVALHASMLVTGHLPSTGTLWNSFKNNYFYSFAQAGGIQVDIMFTISAFLLVSSLLKSIDSNGKSSSNAINDLISFTWKRVARLLPTIIVVSFMGLLLGDDWAPSNGSTDGVPYWKIFAATWTFILNYLPVEAYGSFTLSLCWSCCVDIQAHIAIYLLFHTMKLIVKPASSVAFASTIRWVFFLLVVTSIAIRAYVFDKDTINIFLLGQNSHFGLLMTDTSYKWFQSTYSHVWRATNDFAGASHIYFNNMYSPFHTRFGPFAVGAFLACNVNIANNTKASKMNIVGFILCWFFTLQSIVTLVFPCLPPAPGDVPVIGQHIATAAIRTFASMAISFLMYRCLLSPQHPWHFSLLNNIFSLSVLKPFARLSYCSYLVHFRVLIELCYQPSIKAFLLNGTTAELTTVDGWIEFMHKLFALGLVVSFAAAFILYKTIEEPCTRLFSKQSIKSVPHKDK